jgi:hypothetical protein
MRLYRRQQARKAKRQATAGERQTANGAEPAQQPTAAPQPSKPATPAPAPAPPQRKPDPVVDYLLGEGQ